MFDVYVDSAKCADLCCKHGLSDEPFNNQKAKFESIMMSEAEWLNPVEDQKPSRTNFRPSRWWIWLR